jgi:hypothetical protein
MFPYEACVFFYTESLEAVNDDVAVKSSTNCAYQSVVPVPLGIPKQLSACTLIPHSYCALLSVGIISSLLRIVLYVWLITKVIEFL